MTSKFFKTKSLDADLEQGYKRIIIKNIDEYLEGKNLEDLVKFIIRNTDIDESIIKIKMKEVND